MEWRPIRTGWWCPAAIHDGNDFPRAAIGEEAGNPFFALPEVANVRIADGSVLHERVPDRVRAWAPSIRSAIARAPEFDAAWRDLDCEAIMAEFRVSTPAQTIQPVF